MFPPPPSPADSDCHIFSLTQILSTFSPDKRNTTLSSRVTHQNTHAALVVERHTHTHAGIYSTTFFNIPGVELPRPHYILQLPPSEWGRLLPAVEQQQLTHHTGRELRKNSPEISNSHGFLHPATTPSQRMCIPRTQFYSTLFQADF